jgi:predicted dehydrogenase
MKIGIIGLGYWGPNLVRNFSAQSEVTEVIACDVREERRNTIKKKFPSIKVIDSCEDLVNSDVDAIVIATPVASHFNIAKKCLEAGKHIWVEKPFTASSLEALELLDIAERKKLNIFVDHTFIYTGAVRKMKDLVKSGELGNILYFESERINLGLFQKDVNVIWDLAPHDLSIMDYIMDTQKVVAVCANGIANFNGLENVAHISVYFEEKCFAHFHVNWTSPVKIRRMMVGGDKKMLVFDDMENFEKIKVYDSGIEINTTEGIHEALVQYRIGDMFSPKVNQTEALDLGAKEFIASIIENRLPKTNGYDGLKIVKILEASSKSLANRGEMIEINSFAEAY